MQGDADVVRCASPWPGVAAQLLEALVILGAGHWTVERICGAATVGIAPGDATRVLDGLAIAGVCAQSEDGNTWNTNLNRVELTRLATLLRGAEHYRRLRIEVPSLEIAVTMPMTPSWLEQQLPAAPGRPGGYLPTPAAFLRVASTAQSRLVVLTPFINHTGFEWLRFVFQAANGNVQKIVVLRDVGQYAIDLAVHHANWLQAHRVSIRDYNLSHAIDSGRALPMETFHAKIVLADDRLAYVGSANMLGSGDGTSLEAGVLVDGQAAVQIARLVDAVLRVARRV